MDKSHDLWIIPLRCPRCGASFTSGGDDVIYWCGHCGIGFELQGDRLVEREMAHAEGVAGEGVTRLPFWVFSFSVATAAGKVATVADYFTLSGNIRQLPPEKASRPPMVFIPAFSAQPPLLQRAGRLLTLRAPGFRISAEKPEKIEPIVFREPDARALAEAIILSTVTEERRTNLQFLESFSATTGAGKLLTIPFVQNGERIRQPELNLEI